MTDKNEMSRKDIEISNKTQEEMENTCDGLYKDIVGYVNHNPKRSQKIFNEYPEDRHVSTLSALTSMLHLPYRHYLKTRIALLEALNALEKAEMYSKPLEIKPGEGSRLIQQCKHLIEQVELIFKSEEICLLKNAIDTTLTKEQERTIEKELYKYSRWQSLIRKMEDQIRYIKYETNWKSPSDFSELRELGTTVQRTRNHDGEELRVLEKLDRLYEWKHYYELRKSVVDTALSLMPDDCITLCKERYFKRKRMKQCIQAIVAMNEWQYKQNIRKIKQISAPFLLLVNSAVKPPQKS